VIMLSGHDDSALGEAKLAEHGAADRRGWCSTGVRIQASHAADC
jgi:hypothetical protein